MGTSLQTAKASHFPLLEEGRILPGSQFSFRKKSVLEGKWEFQNFILTETGFRLGLGQGLTAPRAGFQDKCPLLIQAVPETAAPGSQALPRISDWFGWKRPQRSPSPTQDSSHCPRVPPAWPQVVLIHPEILVQPWIYPRILQLGFPARLLLQGTAQDGGGENLVLSLGIHPGGSHPELPQDH